MFDRAFDKLMQFSTWIGQDMRRVQLMLSIFSIIGMLGIYAFYHETMTALKAFETNEPVVEYHPYLFYTCSAFSLIAVQFLIFLAHKGWKVSYTIIFFLVAFFGLVGGYFTTHYVEAEALSAQYYERCTPTYSGRHSAILFARSQTDCDAYKRENSNR